jgi:hypothetical protein
MYWRVDLKLRVYYHSAQATVKPDQQRTRFFEMVGKTSMPGTRPGIEE